MPRKRKPKFRVGQVIYSSADRSYGQIEGSELSEGVNGRPAYLYVITCCAHARYQDELRSLTRKEAGR